MITSQTTEHPIMAGGADLAITDRHIRQAITVEQDMHREIQRIRANEGLLLWDARDAFLSRQGCADIEAYLDKMNVEVTSIQTLHRPITWRWRHPSQMTG